MVISTRDRLDKLRHCIGYALSVETRQDWELIIVDNGSKDGTSEYLSQLSGKTVNTAYVKTMSEPLSGASRARNKGWRAAKGDIVAFTDDDCYVAKDYVEAIIKIFDENPRIGFVSGRILLFDSADLRYTINESQVRHEFLPFTHIPPGAVQGANFALRKTVLIQTGGYDERMGAGMLFACEDIDLAAAALWSGIGGLYDPGPVVFHHHGRKTQDEFLNLWRFYNTGRAAYYAKYILRSKSRWVYLSEWLRGARDDCLTALRARRISKKPFQELYNGLRFVLGR